MKQITFIIVVLVSFTFCKKKNLEPTSCSNPYSTLNDTVHLSSNWNYFNHIDGIIYILGTENWQNTADYYVWSTGETNDSITVSSSADYTVYAYFNNGEVFDSLTFHIGTLTENIQVPNSFTPNWDGINDNFKPIVYAICLDAYSFSVYTDKNDLIFQSNHPNIGWDGNHKGTSAPQGYYTYQIQATTIDGEYIEKKGEIYLLR